MDLITSLALSLIIAAIGLLALFYVIRAAVLSALRSHHAEVAELSTARPISHLDADGL